MATRTREDLINATLVKLHVIEPGQGASAEDFALIRDTYLGSVLSSLSARRVYNYGDPDTIEEECLLHLADCIAYAAAGAFLEQPDLAAKTVAENMLKQIGAANLSGQILQMNPW